MYCDMRSAGGAGACACACAASCAARAAVGGGREAGVPTLTVRAGLAVVAAVLAWWAMLSRMRPASESSCSSLSAGAECGASEAGTAHAGRPEVGMDRERAAPMLATRRAPCVSSEGAELTGEAGTAGEAAPAYSGGRTGWCTAMVVPLDVSSLLVSSLSSHSSQEAVPGEWWPPDLALPLPALRTWRLWRTPHALHRERAPAGPWRH
mmetsp:Transcript_25734/g.65427  ORF Transcript_25734/g.65427 Transcript_25734/m.65427 type:complete len:208 (-) Transcript_25734:385-1008(-)